jgi:hypothetical protein
LPRTRCRRRGRRTGALGTFLLLLPAAALAGAGAACAPGDAARDDPAGVEATAAGDAPALRLIDRAAVELSGVPPATLAAVPEEGWRDALAVSTRDAAGDPGAPPMLGSYDLDDGKVVFRPRFPFAPGVAHVARYRPPGGGDPTTLEFRVEGPEGAGETRVVGIFPSTATWPMNQLKMYLHFSASMRTGRAFEHIRLYDETSGAALEQPFVTVQEELWDGEQRVLTVLYDPARIKRGLVPHEEAGLPLREGHSYRLEIDAGWSDRDGRPLAEPFTATFEVGPVDRTWPDPRRWTVRAPAAGSRDPAVVRFDEPLDHGLLHTLIAVRRASGDVPAGTWRTEPASSPPDEVAGRVEIGETETVWRFIPDAPWSAGRYELVVPAIVEDLAGNTLRGLFDAEMAASPTPFAGAEAAYFGFEIEARD